jgi:hypothetical protein
MSELDAKPSRKKAKKQSSTEDTVCDAVAAIKDENTAEEVSTVADRGTGEAAKGKGKARSKPAVDMTLPLPFRFRHLLDAYDAIDKVYAFLVRSKIPRKLTNVTVSCNPAQTLYCIFVKHVLLRAFNERAPLCIYAYAGNGSASLWH